MATATTTIIASSAVLDAVARVCEDAALTRPAQVRAALEALDPPAAAWTRNPRGACPDNGPFTKVAEAVWALGVPDTIDASLDMARHVAARSEFARHLFAARTIGIDYATIPTTTRGLQRVATRTGLWSRAWASNMLWHAAGEPADVVAYLDRLADGPRLRVSSHHRRLVQEIVGQVIAAEPTTVTALVPILVRLGALGDDAMRGMRPRQVIVDVGDRSGRDPSFADQLAAALIAAGTLTASGWDAVKAADPSAAVTVIVAVRDGHVAVASGIPAVEQASIPVWNLLDAGLWAATKTGSLGPSVALAGQGTSTDPARRVAFAAGIRAELVADAHRELVESAGMVDDTGSERMNDIRRGELEALLAAVPDALFPVVAPAVAVRCDISGACQARPPMVIDALCDRVAAAGSAALASLLAHGSSRWMTGPAAETLTARCGRAYTSTVTVGALHEGSAHRLDGASRYVCDQLGTSHVAWQLFVRLAADTSPNRALDEYLDACVEIAAKHE